MKLLWRMSLVVGLLWPAVCPAGSSDVFRVQTTLNGTVQRGSFSNGIISKVIISVDDLLNLAQRRQLGTPVPNSEILALTSDCSTNDTQPMRLVVFDSAGGTNLVTLGTLSNLTAIAYTRRHYIETMTEIVLNDTSDGTNGITGGDILYHGKINVNTNRCPTAFAGQWTGVLGTTFPLILTNFPCTNFYTDAIVTNCVTVTNAVFDLVERKHKNCTNVFTAVTFTNCVPDGTTNIVDTYQRFDVIIPRSPITTGKSIGTLVEP